MDVKVSSEFITTSAGLNFEVYFLAHLLRDQAISSTHPCPEDKDTQISTSLERLQSIWLMCLYFFIQRLPRALRKVVYENQKSCELVLPTNIAIDSSGNHSDDFRLLHLLPSRDPNSTIKCRLRAASLSQDHSSYDILSYSWAESHKILHIRLGGKFVKVTHTLDSALRYLRHPDEVRVLWVDSLCIIGRDEQGWQGDIARMNSIYTSSNKVIVWLGDESTTSSKAISFLEDLSLRLERTEGLIQFNPPCHPNTLRSLEALSNFLRRSWFSRAGLLAKLMDGRKIEVRCGNRRVDWDACSRVFRALTPISLPAETNSRPFSPQIHQIPYLLPKIPLNGTNQQLPALNAKSPTIVNGLTSTFEEVFSHENKPLSWILAMTRIGQYLAPFLTHLAIQIASSDALGRPDTQVWSFGKDPVNLYGGGPDIHLHKDAMENIEPSLIPEEAGFDFLASAWRCWLAVLDPDWSVPKDIRLIGNISVADSLMVLKTSPNSPLPSRNSVIRLFMVHPNEDQTATIRCEFLSINLSTFSAFGITRGPFCVLPHIWVNDESSECVQTQEQEYRVSSSLAAALRTFRHKKLPFLLWNDSVCMNSIYEHEIGYHINLSNSIFLSAGASVLYGDICDAKTFDTYSLKIDYANEKIRLSGSPGESIDGPSWSLPIVMPSEKSELKQDTTPYTYEKLPSRTSIRLLTLFPPEQTDLKEGGSAFIECSMETVDLDKLPKYNALSYTWGDPLGVDGSPENRSSWYKKNFKIVCDGHSVFISANLYTALLALWLRMFPKYQSQSMPRVAHQPIWIDALCINQDDLDERSQQVSIMARIYRQAISTIIWLGGEDASTAVGLEFLLPLSQRYLQDENIFQGIKELPIANQAAFSLLGLPLITQTRWNGIYAFFSRSWFRRAWIVQEVSLSNNAMILCGIRYFPYDMIIPFLHLQRQGGLFEMTHSIRLISQYPEKMSGPPPDPNQMELAQIGIVSALHTHNIRERLGKSEWRQVTRGMAGPSPLIENIYNFWATEATDSRDKIYSLLGISSEFYDIPRPDQSPSLTPNYRLETRDVFIEASTFMIKSSNSLGLLSLAQDTELKEIKTLPSWVPDFSSKFHVLLFDKFFQYFMAAEGLGPAQIAFPSVDRLEVRGFPLGTIAALTSDTKLDTLIPECADVVFSLPQQSTISVPRENKELTREVLSSPLENDQPVPAEEMSSNYKPSYQGRYEVLWRTLLADCAVNEHPLRPERGVLIRDIFRSVFKDLQIQARDIMMENEHGVETKKKIQDLSNAYKVIQELLNEVPRSDVQDLPPEFEQLVNSVHYRTATKEDIKRAHNEALEEYTREWDTEIDEIEVLVKAAGHKRLLFRTSTGHLGLGPISTNANDEVWVLAGANVPFILRSISEGQYQVIGEAYVHGIMHGEAVEAGAASCKRIQIV